MFLISVQEVAVQISFGMWVVMAEVSRGFAFRP
jgi:hypothetical protein